MRGQPATRISLRSRRSAPLSRWPRLSPEELGPRARETNWHATRQSRGRAQARGHHASDLERSERIPLDGDTIDYRLRAIPEGNSFSKSADARRQRVPLGRGRATPRFSLRHAHRVDRARDIAVPASPTPSCGSLGSGRPRKEPCPRLDAAYSNTAAECHPGLPRWANRQPPARAAPSLVRALRDARGALLFATGTSLPQRQRGILFARRSTGHGEETASSGKNSLATCGAIKERKTAFPAPNKKLSAQPKTTA